MNFVSCPIAGPPSPPRTPSFVQQYGRDSVMLTVQWQSSQDGGGAPVNYTITVSPGLVTFTTTATSATVTIPYNVMHTVSIVATNCNGSSSVVMETVPAIGMACMLPRTIVILCGILMYGQLRDVFSHSGHTGIPSCMLKGGQQWLISQSAIHSLFV